MTICFDIDGVLCDQVEGNYKDAQPRQAMIDLLEPALYAGGHRMIFTPAALWAARRMIPPEAERIGREFTEQQLAGWGVRYHELWMGKPRYDYVIDDRSVFYDADTAHIEEWLEGSKPAWPLPKPTERATGLGQFFSLCLSLFRHSSPRSASSC